MRCTGRSSKDNGFSSVLGILVFTLPESYSRLPFSASSGSRANRQEAAGSFFSFAAHFDIDDAAHSNKKRRQH